MNKLMAIIMAMLITPNALAQDLWQKLEQDDSLLEFEKSMLDTPLPMSVITAEDIAAFGIESIADAITLLPGISMARNEYSDIALGYHELSPVSPRRMLVMIDDTTILQSGLQNVSWWNLPISIDDIDRIELTRAPDATNYGSNSFNGTIHIKTKRKTHRRISSAKYYADGRSKRLTARYQDRFDHSLFAATVSKVKSDGFNDLNDNSGHNAISLSYDYSNQDLALGMTFKRSIGTKQAGLEKNGITLTNVDQAMTLYGLSAQYVFNSHHKIEWSLNVSKWHQFQQLYAKSPLVVLSKSLRTLHRLDSKVARAIVYQGFTPNSDYRHYDLYLKVIQEGISTGLLTGETYQMSAPIEVDENKRSLQVAYGFDNNIWALSLGYSLIKDAVFSPVYLLDYAKHRQTTEQLFVSASYSLGDTTLSSNFMHETSSLIKQGDEHQHVHNNQARISGLHRLDDSSSVRANVSYSYRLPSIWEQQGGFRYFLEVEDNDYDITSGIWFQDQVSAGNLSSEENTYGEVGYHYANLLARTEFDFSVFYSHYQRLIVEQTTLEIFNPTNKHFVDLYGIETELTTKIGGHNLKIFGSIADSRVKQGQPIIDTNRGYSLNNAGFTAQFKLNVLHSYQINDLLSLNSTVGITRGSSQLNSHFIKLGFSKVIKVFGHSQIKTTGFVRYTDQLLIASPFIREQTRSSNNVVLGGSIKVSF
ncbi:MAG: TonB-dependent receptor plug domain-containing protein [Gammaproteobacteria bacterium]|nr:TonB-dependent receptor plug domain-containing protein [Gammaproteobacteria bacterium]